MKKLLLLIVLSLALIGTSFAQYTSNPSPTPTKDYETALYIRCGYSWFTGVVGGELQINKFGIGGGWMPNSTPLTGQKENSYGITGTFYSGNYYENSMYFSVGYIINGYLEESSYGYYETDNILGLLGGYKWSSEMFDLKAGIGFGTGHGMTAFTGELTVGINLLSF